MTREEALKQLFTNYHIDGTEFKDVDYLVNEIYDDFKNRSCESCKHFTTYKGKYGTCKLGVNNRKIEYLHNSFYCNIWEQI